MRALAQLYLGRCIAEQRRPPRTGRVDDDLGANRQALAADAILDFSAADLAVRFDEARRRNTVRADHAGALSGGDPGQRHACVVFLAVAVTTAAEQLPAIDKRIGRAPLQRAVKIGEVSWRETGCPYRSLSG